MSHSATNLLVTGGAGFIGSHLCEWLIRRGATVTVLDDLSTGRIENLSTLIDCPRFRFVPGSAADSRVVEALAQSCDGIIHLAAAVGVELVVRQPAKTVKTNVSTAAIVFAAAARLQKPIWLASSSEVYGRQDAVPFHEEAELLVGSTETPRWSYARSKVQTESLARTHHAETGLPVVVFRLFNTTGPRQLRDYGMVLPRMVHQALRGDPITVYGSGNQTRCFAHVADVVECCSRLIQRAPKACLTVNLGSDREVSINDLAFCVKRVLHSSSPVQFVSYKQAYGQPVDDTMRRVPDLTRLEQWVGAVPKTTLDQIIVSVAAHQQARPVRRSLSA